MNWGLNVIPPFFKLLSVHEGKHQIQKHFTRKIKDKCFSVATNIDLKLQSVITEHYFIGQ